MAHSTSKSVFLILALAMPLALSSCTNHENSAIELDKKVSHTVPVVPVVPAENRQLIRKTQLPGEIRAFEDVPLFAKVEGFVQWIGVDRGSHVKKGDVIIRVSAPELNAKVSEAAAKVDKAQSALLQAKSKLSSAIANEQEGHAQTESDESVYKRLKVAAATPGVVADNDLDVASKKVEAAKDHDNALKEQIGAARSDVAAAESELRAAQQSYKSIADMKEYLTVRAPFDGVITARDVHEGSLVSPTGTPMVRCQEIATLRIVVAVPEIAVAGLSQGKRVPFTVPAFPGKVFYGTIARLGHALDEKTRTMPVELDYDNRDGSLEPGMYPQVSWTVERPYTTTFVPSSAVGHSLSADFVNVIRNGIVHVVPITTGQTMDSSVEVFGDVHAGDTVALKASDDMKEGSQIQAKVVSPEVALKKESGE